MDDRFIAHRADEHALASQALVIPTNNARRDTTEGIVSRSTEIAADDAWVSPAQFCKLRPERLPLHTTLLERELLGIGSPVPPSASPERISRVSASLNASFDLGIEAVDDGLNAGHSSGLPPQMTPPRRVLSFRRPAESTSVDEGTAINRGGSPQRSSALSRPGSFFSPRSAFAAMHLGSGMGPGMSAGSPRGAAPSPSVSASAVHRARMCLTSISALPPLSAESQLILEQARQPARRIAAVPYRVLDAAGLQDDFYSSPVDWSSRDVVAAALASGMYIFDCASNKVTPLATRGTDDPVVTSVKWSTSGNRLAVGDANGLVSIWDATKQVVLRTLDGHSQRCATMDWCAHVLATGSKDKSILLRDLRESRSHCGRLTGHRAEVCGLRFSPSWHTLASGGNENFLMVWDHRMLGTSVGLRTSSSAATADSAPGSGLGPGSRSKESDSSSAQLWKFPHTAAVRALAWSPHRRGLLASGGGNADKHLRFWCTESGRLLDSVDTGSQVCSLQWSPGVDELVSTHGLSTHAVAVWRYPSLARIATLYGHTNRVLFSALSADGTTLVTGAGGDDATMRFWALWPPRRETGGATPGSTAALDSRASAVTVGSAGLVSPMREGSARHVSEVR